MGTLRTELSWPGVGPELSAQACPSLASSWSPPSLHVPLGLLTQLPSSRSVWLRVQPNYCSQEGHAPRPAASQPFPHVLGIRLGGQVGRAVARPAWGLEGARRHGHSRRPLWPPVPTGSSFSCEQRAKPGTASLGVSHLAPYCPLPASSLPERLQGLTSPSGLSSRSMDETLSRLFRWPRLAAKGLAMTPGDT